LKAVFVVGKFSNPFIPILVLLTGPRSPGKRPKHR
jgi:hypothetical protein